MEPKSIAARVKVAPPVVEVSSREKARLQALFADPTKLEKHAEYSESAEFFDGAPLQVRTRRDNARAKFELFVQMRQGAESMRTEDIWSADTILSNTKLFISTYTEGREGDIGDKVRPNVLWNLKDDISWWAKRFLHTFNAIATQWHRECDGLIATVCVGEKLEPNDVAEPTKKRKRNEKGRKKVVENAQNDKRATVRVASDSAPKSPDGAGKRRRTQIIPSDDDDDIPVRPKRRLRRS
ncbi:hypothetical protein NA57DRAFT_75927 [Rhizodiscina lignyota]|uniref:Uncharacterized protein n=1 Tax=Rhizodiscina lignyota TaxID=1504668 RepID=A0A9P4IGD7_9PEZI|nr:hypothetical protein NA57DRAFT_75927 [Rhizodiscina lignyota]